MLFVVLLLPMRLLALYPLPKTRPRAPHKLHWKSVLLTPGYSTDTRHLSSCPFFKQHDPMLINGDVLYPIICIYQITPFFSLTDDFENMTCPHHLNHPSVLIWDLSISYQFCTCIYSFGFKFASVMLYPRRNEANVCKV